jgi:hypothetical protein
MGYLSRPNWPSFTHHLFAQPMKIFHKNVDELPSHAHHQRSQLEASVSANFEARRSDVSKLGALLQKHTTDHVPGCWLFASGHDKGRGVGRAVVVCQRGRKAPRGLCAFAIRLHVASNGPRHILCAGMYIMVRCYSILQLVLWPVFFLPEECTKTASSKVFRTRQA